METLIKIPATQGKHEWYFTESHKQSLANVLSSYDGTIDLEYFISIVMSFLDVKLSIGLHQYQTYCHGTKNISRMTLCDIWCEKNLQDGEVYIVIMGHGGAGKSALTIRYVTGEFLDEYDPTIEDSYRKAAYVDGHAVLYDILDTAGQEEFSCMMYDYYRRYRRDKIYLLLFAIDSKEGLKECTELLVKIIRSNDLHDEQASIYHSHSDEICVILVATKLDLLYNADIECYEHRLQIMRKNQENAMKFSKMWNIPYIETSAKEDINVELLFRQVVYEYFIQTQGRIINWKGIYSASFDYL